MLVASVGVNFAAVRLFETSMENANTIYLAGYHITDVIGLTMGIPILLLGITLGLCDDILRRGIGALYIINWCLSFNFLVCNGNGCFSDCSMDRYVHSVNSMGNHRFKGSRAGIN